ncbi:MAG: sialidase family protein [Gemmatimonadaceae bacterium]|nr:sialidase family protein [Gemmatimonadaceae bacterium]
MHLLRLIMLSAAAACASGRGGSAASPLVPLEQVTTVGTRTREPMLVQHPNGALFVAGYAVSSQGVWTSTDLGKRWTPVTFGADAAGLIGNSDTDLAVAPDGTLYFASMTYDRRVFEGTQIAIAVSEDAGVSWRWSLVSRNRFDDRPWVKIAPDGTAHVIWNDGSGVHHRISRDRGASWITMPRISARGGSSHLAIGAGGQIAARVAPISASGNRNDPEVDSIKVSVDGGATWAAHSAPGHPVWSATSLDRWVEPLAWTADGRLFAAWTEGGDVWLGRSTDLGATWASWRIRQGVGPAFYPYLTVSAQNELAITWHSGARDSLRWHLATLAAPSGAALGAVRISEPMLLDAWTWPVDKPDVAPVRASAGEYLAALFLRDGGLGVVTPVQSKARDGFTWWRFVR